MKLFYKQLKNNPSCFITNNVIDSLEQLKQTYKDLGCSDKQVFGFGARNPKIMFVGLKPSETDVKSGMLFGGKLGVKLQGIIEYLSRQINLENNIYYSTLFLCNVKPTNYFYNDKCVKKACDKLIQEIEIINPQNIIFLGYTLARLFYFRLQTEFKVKEKNVIKLDKYYDTYTTYDLETILYKNDEYKYEVKKDLDYIIKYLITI